MLTPANVLTDTEYSVGSFRERDGMGASWSVNLRITHWRHLELPRAVEPN